MSKKTLLQEAIAEAKELREAAIKNAYKALEENLTPSIKEMLATKLEEEMSLNEEDDEEQVTEDINAGFKKVSEPKKATVKEAEESEEPEEEKEEPAEEPDGDEEGGEANGDHEEPDGDEPEAAEAEVEGPADDTPISDLTLGDLRTLFQDLAAEMSAPAPEGDMGADMTAGDVEGMGDEEAPLEGEPEEELPAEEPVGDDLENPEEKEDDEIDLSELLRELEDEKSKDPRGKYHRGGVGNEDHEMAECKEQDPGKGDKKFKKLSEELEEAYKTVETLKTALSETNLLNSKLVYTTRMLGKDNLSESQKAKIIRAFDNAKSIKDVKLVYQTLNENLGSVSSKKNLREYKSIASRAAGKSTAAPKEMIVESNDMVKRFQQLAGIIN